VAFDASAELRETRGFISMMTMRPSFGLMANCTFEPPVSTPISRRQRIAPVAHHLILAGRCRGLAGATVMESPVWTPIGSKFSTRADNDDVVGEVAHHLKLEFLPAERAFLNENSCTGERSRPAFEDGNQIFAVVGNAAAGTAHSETGAQDGGVAVFGGEVEAAFYIGNELRRRGFEADLRIASWKRRRSSAFLMASIFAPISSTP